MKVLIETETTVPLESTFTSQHVQTGTSTYGTLAVATDTACTATLFQSLDGVEYTIQDVFSISAQEAVDFSTTFQLKGQWLYLSITPSGIVEPTYTRALVKVN